MGELQPAAALPPVPGLIKSGCEIKFGFWTDKDGAARGGTRRRVRTAKAGKQLSANNSATSIIATTLAIEVQTVIDLQPVRVLELRASTYCTRQLYCLPLALIPAAATGRASSTSIPVWHAARERLSSLLCRGPALVQVPWSFVVARTQPRRECRGESRASRRARGRQQQGASARVFVYIRIVRRQI